MPSFSVIKKSITDWVKSQALVDEQAVIWQFQNGPVPVKPYFTLRILSLNQVGDAEFVKSTSGEEDERDMITNIDFTLEIFGFGTGIVEKTVALKNSLNLPLVHETFRESGVISFNNTESVLDVSGIDNSENEERSSYDTFMRTFETVTNVPVGAIEIMNSEGTFKQPGKPDIIQDVNVDSTI